MGLYTGTSGFSYPEWRGAFYPERLPAREMLGHYAVQLPAVEINLTFYRRPSPALLANWVQAVPASFRFVFKAPRGITHVRRWRDIGAQLNVFLDPLYDLGPLLGAVLFQLPPDMQRDDSRLEAFLDVLPASPRAAVEFRHPSWWDDAVFERLRAREVALCLADADPALPQLPVRTAPWCYLRLRHTAYTDAQLRAWLGFVNEGGDGFVFFKHEDAATGPALAQRLLRLAQDQ